MTEELRYQVAGLCVLAFLAAQVFQEVAYRFLIPAAQKPEEELANYLRPADRLRAILVGGSILLLVVPYITIALRYRAQAPVASVLGLVFGLAFVGCEIAHRSLEFFLVGDRWASRLSQASDSERATILDRFAAWGDISRAWYFPLLLAHFLASCCFLAAMSAEGESLRWQALGPAAFALNAIRLVGRLASMFAGQKWLDALNHRLYFPAVVVINALLASWFFALARHVAQAG
jgi:hypothetical protein